MEPNLAAWVQLTHQRRAEQRMREHVLIGLVARADDASFERLIQRVEGVALVDLRDSCHSGERKRGVEESR